MNILQVRCRLRHDPAALERFLRLLRVQGFTVVELRASGEVPLDVDARVDGSRPPEALAAQLGRLCEVQSVVPCSGTG